MKNISFDNPYLLLIAIPAILLVLIPFLIIRNKDNKSGAWTISLFLHIIIIALISIVVAGLSKTTLLTETTIYVVADVSHSSEKNLDKIDEYIEEINENLPEKTKLGVVCFGKNCVITTTAGRKLSSVKNSGVDSSATNIVSALNFTEKLFTDDTLKKIILITDGNDTVNESTGSIASAIERLTENGVEVDAIFLDNSIGEGDTELQLMGVEAPSTTYIGKETTAKALIQSSADAEALLELYSRVKGDDTEEYELVSQAVLTVEKGLTSHSITLPADETNIYEYRIVINCDKDISDKNNTRHFIQEVVGNEKILLITGNYNDESLIKSMYGENAEIDTYVVRGSGSNVPFMLEELVKYDEIIVSDVDVRDIKNVNAFINSLDMVISQYGKSLITMGDLKIQTNLDDVTLQRFSELLPLGYGSTNRDGKLYTLVLDISKSMFTASKFTTAKQSAIKLISVMDEEDYVCLVTFSGDVKVQTPKQIKDCKQELIDYINGLKVQNGTDLGLGLEQALKTIDALNLTENQVMVISDGLSFSSEYDAVEISKTLNQKGAIVSAIWTPGPTDGTKGQNSLTAVTESGGGKPPYKITKPEDVVGVVFGSVADDIGEVIIIKDASVNIAKYKDEITKGFESFPTVSGFLISLERFDATVPLTITYEKANGYQETVPLYAYRSHGNGRISSLATSLTSEWTRHWSNEQKGKLVINMLSSNTPEQRNDLPFSASTETTGYNSYVEIVPSVLNPDATVKIKIKNPRGKSITRDLTFDAKKYSYSFATDIVGVYTIDITYSYDDKSFTTSKIIEIPYLKEYDEFAVFDKYTVYQFMRGNGEITVDEIPSLEIDQSKVTTYKETYDIPLLIAAVVLFVIDVFVRKLRVKRKGNKTGKERAKNA